MVRNRAATYYYGTTIIDSTAKLIFFNLSFSFFEAWGLMVLLGMLAGYLSIPGLAIGYWATWVVALLWSIAKGSTASVRSEK